MPTQSQPPTPDSLWDANDVAAYLKVSRSWVYLQKERGALPYLKIGALVRFVPEVVRQFARGEVAVAGAQVVELRGPR
jgi:predicted DNA-binding transcriptional regulator AlpA